MAQLDDRFQTFECEFDLPPEPITLQHLPSGGSALGQRREHQDIADIFAFFWRNLAFALLLLECEFALRPLDCMLTFADSTEASRYLLVPEPRPHPPFRRFPGPPRRSDVLQ